MTHLTDIIYNNDDLVVMCTRSAEFFFVLQDSPDFFFNF